MDGYRVDNGEPELFVKLGEGIQFLHLEQKKMCIRDSLWGEDLSLYPRFYDAVLSDLTRIRALGAREALTRFLRG